jgi:hypothetical protein
MKYIILSLMLVGCYANASESAKEIYQQNYATDIDPDISSFVKTFVEKKESSNPGSSYQNGVVSKVSWNDGLNAEQALAKYSKLGAIAQNKMAQKAKASISISNMLSVPELTGSGATAVLAVYGKAQNGEICRTTISPSSPAECY